MTANQFEKLVISIMEDAEKEGEPVTREEALEIARMEMKANEEKRHYEKSDTKKKRVVKKDPEKLKIIAMLNDFLKSEGYDSTIANDTRQIDFGLYSLTLVKHKPKKA